MATSDDEKFEIDFTIDSSTNPIAPSEVTRPSFSTLQSKVHIRMSGLEISSSSSPQKDVYCIEFNRMSGSLALFNDAYKYLKTEVLNGFCDIDPDDIQYNPFEGDDQAIQEAGEDEEMASEIPNVQVMTTNDQIVN